MTAAKAVERVTIMVKIDTRKRLGELGTVDDSMDDVISKLIDHYNNFTINGDTSYDRKSGLRTRMTKVK